LFIQVSELESAIKEINAFYNKVAPLFAHLRKPTAPQTKSSADEKSIAPAENDVIAHKGQPSGQAVAANKKGPDDKPTGAGAPLYAANQGSGMSLKLPDKKKKPGQGASPSPAPEIVMTRAFDNKPANQKSAANPVVRQPPAAPKLPHKCFLPTCLQHISGFATQAEADKHAEDEHGFSGNYVSWMLLQMKTSLGVKEDVPAASPLPKLDDNLSLNQLLRPLKGKGKAVQHVPAATTAAVQAPYGADLMARSTPNNATQSSPGAKAQTSVVKQSSPTGGPTSLKRTADALDGSDPQGSPTKKAAVSISTGESWSTSLVTREAIHHAFRDIEYLTDTNTIGPVYDLPRPPLVEGTIRKADSSNTQSELLDIDVQLDGWPSPPPVTFGESPDSTESAKDVVSNPHPVTAPVDLNLDDMNFESFNVDSDYNFQDSDNKGMSWNDSGLGLDSFETDPFAPETLALPFYYDNSTQGIDLDEVAMAPQ
jgi:hypothetical protein